MANIAISNFRTLEPGIITQAVSEFIRGINFEMLVPFNIARSATDRGTLEVLVSELRNRVGTAGTEVRFVLIGGRLYSSMEFDT